MHVIMYLHIITRNARSIRALNVFGLKTNYFPCEQRYIARTSS